MTCPRFTLVIALVGATALARAQSPTAGRDDVGDLASGWAAMAAGDANKAAALALAAVLRHPGNVALGTLLVQAETSRAGAVAGLSAYEQWLGNRATDDPYLIRSIAVDLLCEAVRVTPSGEPQRRAFDALVAEGDPAILASLGQAASPGSVIGADVLGALGDKAAVQTLIAALKDSSGNRTRAIIALAATKSPLAVRPLIDVLSDPLPANRIAAADALGRLEAPAAAAPLRELMKDRQIAVKVAAAGALFRLHDSDGTAFLWNMASSQHPMVQAQALEAMATDPSPAWLAAVRPLLTDPDPEVRLLGAKLIAPHDPAAANAAIQILLHDGNTAVVEAATNIYVERVVTDFPSLRRLLHSADLSTRVNAAVRVLALTR